MYIDRERVCARAQLMMHPRAPMCLHMWIYIDFAQYYCSCLLKKNPSFNICSFYYPVLNSYAYFSLWELLDILWFRRVRYRYLCLCLRFHNAEPSMTFNWMMKMKRTVSLLRRYVSFWYQRISFLYIGINTRFVLVIMCLGFFLIH